jgi:hypothetical protein
MDLNNIGINRKPFLNKYFLLKTKIMATYSKGAFSGKVRQYNWQQLAQRRSLGTLERLADADAFRSIGLDRRKAL